MREKIAVREMPETGVARRMEILEAAAEVFAEKGFQRATMKQIAARARVAPGTIYLYFANKRELLMAIADELIGRPIDQTLSQSSHLSTVEYVEAIIRERLEFAERNRELLKALVPEIWTDMDLQQRFLEQVMIPILRAAERRLQERIAAGELRPCRIDVVVPTLAGALIMLTAFRALAPEHILAGIPENDIIRELTLLFLKGLSRTNA